MKSGRWWAKVGKAGEKIRLHAARSVFMQGLGPKIRQREVKQKDLNVELAAIVKA